jgi:hypothetical protein
MPLPPPPPPPTDRRALKWAPGNKHRRLESYPVMPKILAGIERAAARDTADISYRTHGLHFSLFCEREVWMPWRASSVMEERLRFVARLLDGEAMTDVCREFGVSRKTGYKILIATRSTG